MAKKTISQAVEEPKIEVKLKLEVELEPKVEEPKIHIGKYLQGRDDISGIIKSMLEARFKDMDTKRGWEKRIYKELNRRYD